MTNFELLGIGSWIIVGAVAIIFSLFAVLIAFGDNWDRAKEENDPKAKKKVKQKSLATFIILVVLLSWGFALIMQTIYTGDRKNATKYTTVYAKQLTSLISVSNKYYDKYHQYGTLDSLYVFDPELQDVLAEKKGLDETFNYRPTIIPSGALLNSNIVGTTSGTVGWIHVSMIWRDGKVIKWRCHSKVKLVNEINACRLVAKKVTLIK